jgi:hypothetical protein
MTTGRKRALAGAIAVIVAVIVGVGAVVVIHGGDATASSNTAAQASGRLGQAPPAGSGSSASREKFRQCLQENGVTLPQPGTSGSRPDHNDPGFARAMQACRQYMPQRAPGGGFGPPGSGQNATPPQQPTTDPGT